METNLFSPMEIDAIGEIMNISLGSSATAVSNMLGHRVDITTPRVSVVKSKDLVLGTLEPAIGVEIRYTSGLEGSNFMLLKRSDVKIIVDILMGSETPDEEFELNDLTISAVCEVMNQMMGAASTALSDFLEKMVNISTPESFELNDFEAFKLSHFPPEIGDMVVVRFGLSIEDALSSEFVNVISVELARGLLAGVGLENLELPAAAPAPAPTPEPAPAPASTGGTLSQEEIERLLAGGADAPPPAPSAPAPGGGGTLSQEEIERLMQGGAPPAQADPAVPPPPPGGAYPPYGAPWPGYYPPPGQQPFPGYYPPPGYFYPPEPGREPPEPKVIPTQPVSIPQMDAAERLGGDQAQNLDLIMTVPLEVSVEIGRTRRKVQEILTFSKGSLVVLDKLAGDQVDLFVNGQCIAKGDVVVVDDNFGIRITEILKPTEPGDLIQP